MVVKENTKTIHLGTNMNSNEDIIDLNMAEDQLEVSYYSPKPITTIEQLVKIDKKMEAKIDELETEVKDIKEQREKVRETILEMMKEQGLESTRTASGTVTRVTTDRYWSSDWAAMHEYIMEHGAIYLLEKRVAQKAMDEWLATHPDDHPPGLNISSKHTVKITKPRKTIED